ncbi:MAG: RagB/SusD family nutrient uptake outer membrane protein [Bacteroidales bacterium]|nr:RagB/SusD family nutrient uptake outer membrane protein [Bacteroidales bacterium]
MIKSSLKYLLMAFAAMTIALSGCIGDLDTLPLDKDEVTSASVYENPQNYVNVLAKLYAGLSLSGQQGPAGRGDISGMDEGFGQYLRGYFYLQELPTDEALIGWNDATLRDLHDVDWTASDGFISTFYYRVFYQVSACNEFIRETTPEKLAERNITGDMQSKIETYRAEARFLRALSYYHAIDLFGNVPFVTEEDAVGSFFPEQISRKDLFTYLETELKDIEEKLMAPRSEYGRADKGAAWMLLAKLYMNAKIYTGEEKYTEAITYLNKVIGAGYTLENDYANLFKADNHKSKEIIFPIAFDGTNAKTYGGTTFIVKAAIGGKMDPAAFGVDGGWGGLRTTKQFVGKFWNLATLKDAQLPLKKAVAYPVIYVPGGYQSGSGYSAGDWSPGDAPQLASVSSDDKYEGYIYFAADAEFKFTAGPSWDLNWGDDGANGTLEQNGANLKATAGYYKINVDLNTMTYSLVKTDWGLIGDATPGGWDTDTNMEYDPVTKMWKLIVELGSGGYKFRANDGWDINLGDTGADGILEYGGDNIASPGVGRYEIKLKLGTPDYSFTIEKYATDNRAMFFTEGQTLEVEDLFEFTRGYAITKWSNMTSTGVRGSAADFVDTDFPVFRLADAYLMYAEAVLRGGSGGSATTALQYVNAVRERAYQDVKGHIGSGDLNLNFLLDERARELYWECHRRTDLIRFGRFTGNSYIWAWKGGVKDGAATDAKYNLFPLASSDVAANINLKQNTGY